MAVKPVDPKTSSIGDRLWIDTNGNGVQDGSEIGMGGVTVQLLNATGKLLATTTSAADGSYLFTGLAADVYQLQFGNKDGYGFTRRDIDNDLSDSDANVTTGRSQYVALGIAEHNRTVDAGYVAVDPKTSSIGDYVWIDGNKDGVQNDGATGIANVTVNLLDASGKLLATQQTGTNGSYLFDHLAAGQYQVQFGSKAGYTFTGMNLGTDDGKDSDANTTSGLSQVVTLGINEHNGTVDAGVVAVAPVDNNNAQLGDRDLRWQGRPLRHGRRHHGNDIHRERHRAGINDVVVRLLQIHQPGSRAIQGELRSAGGLCLHRARPGHERWLGLGRGHDDRHHAGRDAGRRSKQHDGRRGCVSHAATASFGTARRFRLARHQQERYSGCR